jgi:signal transduction histidine kinase
MRILDAHLAASLDGVLVVGAGGRVLMHNARFASLWGLGPEALRAGSDEVLQRAMAERVEDPNGFLGRMAQLYRDRATEARDEIRLKTGAILDRYSRLMGGTSALDGGRIWFFRDISERRRVEEDLQASNRRLKELNQMKTHFVNTAAHQLATPLTPMRFQVHLLKSGKFGKLSPPQLEAFQLIERNLERLSALMVDILDASSSQNAPPALAKRPFELSGLLQRMVDDARKDNPNGPRLAFQGEGQALVEGDIVRIQQAIHNLLANAIKFTPPSGRVDVRLETLAKEAVVHVQDTGIGLKSQDFPRLFQPFSQVHNTMDRTNAGTGLGLVIAQGIVEQHGGRIWCDSAGPGKGSTFSLSLPLSEQEAAKAASGSSRKGRRGIWPLVYFKCPVCESRDIDMRIIKNMYECNACHHAWR